MIGRPRMLVVSHVLPYPRTTGQQQRVYYTLRHAREHFHITFATIGGAVTKHAEAALADLCDDIVELPSRYQRSGIYRLYHKAASGIYSLATGLKPSNYIIGQVEFGPDRIAELASSGGFVCVLLEYWHAWQSAVACRKLGLRCILDTHNVLWRGHESRLREFSRSPSWWQARSVARYRAAEERAWKAFDTVIAISRGEEETIRSCVGAETKVFYGPMGTNLEAWPYSWKPASPPRLAYYGGLGSAHNQCDARKCFELIMPHVWARHPEAEFWIVGSNPPPDLLALGADRRVHVTGFVPDVQRVLRSMTAVLCPWSGTYGFRSRVIEVMALGVPLVATPDTVWGMDLEEGKGFLPGVSMAELATWTNRLLDDPAFASEQSSLARRQVERSFSLDNTYGRLMGELHEWLASSEVVGCGS